MIYVNYVTARIVDGFWNWLQIPSLVEEIDHYISGALFDLRDSIK